MVLVSLVIVRQVLPSSSLPELRNPDTVAYRSSTVDVCKR